MPLWSNLSVTWDRQVRNRKFQLGSSDVWFCVEHSIRPAPGKVNKWCMWKTYNLCIKMDLPSVVYFTLKSIGIRVSLLFLSNDCVCCNVTLRYLREVAGLFSLRWMIILNPWSVLLASWLTSTRCLLKLLCWHYQVSSEFQSYFSCGSPPLLDAYRGNTVFLKLNQFPYTTLDFHYNCKFLTETVHKQQ